MKNTNYKHEHENMVLIRQHEIRGTERYRRPSDEQEEAEDLNTQKDNEGSGNTADTHEHDATSSCVTPQGKQK